MKRVPFAVLRCAVWLAIVVGILATATSAMAVAPGLPPRPMPGDGDNGDDGGGGGMGSQIVLIIHLSTDDTRNLSAWRALWTIVQWQDGTGQWHDVDNWQGAPKGNPGDAYHQAYAIDERNYGKGPFRWIVRTTKGSTDAAVSQPFNLPRNTSEAVRIDVAVAFAPPTAAVLRVLGAAARAASLITALEWSDGSTQWYEVVGSISVLATDGTAAVWTYRVPDGLRGQGTFRFVVYLDRTRGPAAVSTPFRMPAQAGQSVTVSAVLN
ncbi:MAG: hypothetical protein HZB53_18010 [Chloroflexi bacterium]|nr:hypothetical protein [Chloroflexota bacterium]